MKSPEQVAADIVGQFGWSTNVIGPNGNMVGQQVVVAQKISEAVKSEREEVERMRAELVRVKEAIGDIYENVTELIQSMDEY